LSEILSVVVIGYNEGANLKACLESVREADSIPGYEIELIYVDGGSSDNSLEISRSSTADQILGGDKRRRAAENRNLGLKASSGSLIQFLDGDMLLKKNWLTEAVNFLTNHSEFAAVCGNLEELNRSIISRAMEIDWGEREESIRHCGGAALWSRDVLLNAGGFPEDVDYGEDPLVCWKIRNEFGFKIYQLNKSMVIHDLGHVSFIDYWKRCIRSGRTYSEISELVKDTSDPLWLKETRANYLWGVILLGLVLTLLLPLPSLLPRLISSSVLLCLIFRKTIQTLISGKAISVSLMYSIHTYTSKIAIAYGQLRWHLKNKKRVA